MIELDAKGKSTCLGQSNIYIPDTRWQEPIARSACPSYLKKYTDIIENSPTLLTREQETEQKNTLKTSKGVKKVRAQETLVNSNYRLIMKRVAHYQSHTHLPIEDLVSSGLQGLITALDRFNFKYNSKI